MNSTANYSVERMAASAAVLQNQAHLAAAIAHLLRSAK
jgi:hypothetical protein